MSLVKVHQLLEVQAYSAAVNECGKILEILLRGLYRQCLDDMPALNKKEVLGFEEKIGAGKALNDFTLGQLIGLFTQANLFRKIAEQKKIKTNFFMPDMLNRINDLRNRCEHKNHDATKTEAEWVVNVLSNIFDELNVTPRKIEPKLKTDEKTLSYVRQILWVMAEKPEYGYEEDIELEGGALYFAYALVKFAGVYREGNEIKVEVKLAKSEIQPDDFEHVARHICNDMYKKICKANPEIRKTKLHFRLIDEGGWEFEEEYPKTSMS